MEKLFETPPIIIAVDVANLAYRAATAPNYSTLSTSDGRPSGHVFGTASILMSLIKKISPNHSWEFWFATEGYPKWRYELIPSYKSNRDTRKVADPLPDVVDMVKLFPGEVWKHPKLEADDVLSRLIRRRKKNQRMVIVSGDHDLWQLFGGKNLEIMAGKEIVTKERIQAKFGIKNPRAVALVKALFGDTSDTIKPCAPRLPRKPLKDLINIKNCITPGDLLLCISHKQELQQAFSGRSLKQIIKAAALLEEYERQLWINYKVIKLRVKSKIQPKCSPGGKSPAELKRFFRSWECKSLIKRMGVLWPGE